MLRRANAAAGAVAAAPLLLILLLAQAAPAACAKGPRVAVYNPVHFHLEVVAGAAYVLRQLTEEPVHVYLPAKVLKSDWYGFLSWLGGMEGLELRDSEAYDGTTYDLVWFVSPEFVPPAAKMTTVQHTDAMRKLIGRMQPKVLMYMVHNGHMADAEWAKVKSLASADVPVLTLSPHVAASIGNRSLPLAPDWILPIYPFEPRQPCALADLEAGRQCVRGFSVQGRIEKSRRNYTEVWEQIGGHKRHHTAKTVANFKLNILGEVVEAFDVPVEVRDLVAVYKNPPYPVFYDVVAHSLALVPMLASPLYYKSKFSSTVLTSLITGVPIIADQRMLDAYTMLSRESVFFQPADASELEVMFSVAKMDPREMWAARAGVEKLRAAMNARAQAMIKGWLTAKGVAVSEARRALAPKRRRLAAAGAERQGAARWLRGPPLAGR